MSTWYPARFIKSFFSRAFCAKKSAARLKSLGLYECALAGPLPCFSRLLRKTRKRACVLPNGLECIMQALFFSFPKGGNKKKRACEGGARRFFRAKGTRKKLLEKSALKSKSQKQKSKAKPQGLRPWTPPGG
ncbi:MAG: hypothetical protein HQM03_04140 [Magnetococcales bacterium]|nr:hypothetical protein [Magnetococcales bacterium]